MGKKLEAIIVLPVVGGGSRGGKSKLNVSAHREDKSEEPQMQNRRKKWRDRVIPTCNWKREGPGPEGKKKNGGEKDTGDLPGYANFE